MKDMTPHESRHSAAGAGTRVLVIDDDDQFRGFLAELLRTRGYEVLQASNGKEGLRLFEGQQPQLVITDIVMPEEEGVGLIWQLRRDHPRLPIIAVSGGNKCFGEDYLRIAQKLGANAALSKPFAGRDLLQHLERLLAEAGPTSRRGA